MLTIYGSDLSSPANKVRFVANYLGLKYEYKKIDLAAGEHRQPEMIKLNPVGKVPFINDDGFVLSESGAIIKYLADKTNSPIYPRGLKERAFVDQQIDFVTLHVLAAMQKVTYNRIFAARRGIPVDQNSLEEGQAFLKRFLPIIEETLSKNSHLCGNAITIADFTLLSGLDPAEHSGFDLTPYPHIVKWRENLRKQSFYTACYKEWGESLKQPAKA